MKTGVKAKIFPCIAITLVLFLFGLIYGEAYSGIKDATDTECVTAATAQPTASDLAGSPRVVDIIPQTTALNRDICIVVAGVSTSLEADRLKNEREQAKGLNEEAARMFTEADETARNAKSAAEAQKQRVADMEVNGATPSPELQKTKNDLNKLNSEAAAAATKAAGLKKIADDFAQIYRSAVVVAESPPPNIELKLTINGVAAPHLTLFAKPGPHAQAFKKHLNTEASATSDEGKFWRAIFTGAVLQYIEGQWGKKELSFAVSRTNSNSIDPQAKVVTLVLFEKILLILALVCFALLILIFVLTAGETNMLREGGAKDQPFSLSRTQMAFWFFIVTGGILYSWIILGQYNGIMTPGVLTLLGIGGTTVVAAGSMNIATKTKANFWEDLVCDGNGIQLQRIQALVWTLILGAIFCWNVIVNFQMPNFDTNLLILIAVSQAVYVGMKPQEKSTPVL